MDSLRKSRGAVSLEALVSLQLLFLLLVISWSVAQLIYEYSMANSAAQAAAQSVVREFDRKAPSRCGISQTLCNNILTSAQSLGRNIFSANFCNNESRLSERGECTTSDPPDVFLQCRSQESGENPDEAEDIVPGPGVTWESCVPTDKELKIVVIRATVRKSIDFTGIAFFDVMPDVTVRARSFAWRALEDEP